MGAIREPGSFLHRGSKQCALQMFVWAGGKKCRLQRVSG